MRISAEHSASPVTLLSYHITPSASLCVTVLRAANSIQRIKKESSLSETQPPPYQDEGSAVRVSSRSRSERGVRRGSSPQRCDSPRCSSEASVEQDTESYLNKGCEEDIPSDSTAVLGPEVRAELLCVPSSVTLSSTNNSFYSMNIFYIKPALLFTKVIV